MKRIRMTALAVATAASVAAIPVAIAAASEGGHHSEHAKSGVVYRATGVVTTAPDGGCTTVTLSGTHYSRNAAGVTQGGVQVVNLNSATTKFVKSHASALCSAILLHDRVQITWKESDATTSFATAANNAAYRVKDLGPATVTFTARGLATSAVCSPTPTTVTLNTVKYSDNTLQVPLTADSLIVNVDGTTKFRGRGEHHHGAPAAGCSGIQTNDRIVVTWKEPYGTPFNPAAIATSVRDRGPAHPVVYQLRGIATTTESCVIGNLRGSENIQTLPGSPFDFSALLSGTVWSGQATQCSGITAGDHIKLTWKEPAGTAVNTSVALFSVVDSGQSRGEHRR